LNLRPEQSNAFFKLMEERYADKRTTVITTNLAYEAWYEFLGNKKMVEALLGPPPTPLPHHHHRGTVAAYALEHAGPVKLRRLPRAPLCIEVPVLEPREAEALIDLLEQIQGALWDSYGDAILAHAPDRGSSSRQRARQSPGSDDPPF